MPAQGTIWAPDGRVLFSTQWPQMTLVTKGRVTANTQDIGIGGGRTPIIALRPINCAGAVDVQYNSGANYTWRIAKVLVTAADSYIDYWIYDRVPPQVPTSGVTLYLLDEARNCTFRADALTMTFARASAQPGGRIHAVASAPGFAWSLRFIERTDSRGNVIGIENQQAVGGWWFNGSTFEMRWGEGSPHDFGTTVEGTYDPSASGYMVLDVTNH